MIKLVLVRHGESEWNLKHDFTGWHDCDLTSHGRKEARTAGDLLRSQGFVFDLAYTSVLIRAIHTLWIILDRVRLSWIPITRSWKLNERHYGALEGLDKREIRELFGDEQLQEWRRSWDKAPPALEQDDDRHPRFDPRYDELSEKEMPETESLKDCVARVLPYWNKEIVPKLKEKKRVLIVAHGNSLRGIVKFLDNISEKDIVNLNIPTGVPLVYELDEKTLKPIKHYYLGNQAEIQKRIDSVKNQAK